MKLKVKLIKNKERLILGFNLFDRIINSQLYFLMLIFFELSVLFVGLVKVFNHSLAFLIVIGCMIILTCIYPFFNNIYLYFNFSDDELKVYKKKLFFHKDLAYIPLSSINTIKSSDEGGFTWSGGWVFILWIDYTILLQFRVIPNQKRVVNYLKLFIDSINIYIIKLLNNRKFEAKSELLNPNLEKTFNTLEIRELQKLSRLKSKGRTYTLDYIILFLLFGIFIILSNIINEFIFITIGLMLIWLFFFCNDTRERKNLH